jgi:hypothetical protein
VLAATALSLSPKQTQRRSTRNAEASLVEGALPMPKSRKLPRLDFAPSPNRYRAATNGNGRNGSQPKPAHRVDLSPRLELSLQCEVECETPKRMDSILRP